MDTPVVPTSAFAARAITILTAPIRMPRRPSAKWMATESDPGCSAAGTYAHDQGAGRPDRDQQWLLRAVGHSGSVNQKTVTRHYGFGATQGTVTIGGVAVPLITRLERHTDHRHGANVRNVPITCRCAQSSSRHSTEDRTHSCGELVITAANGKQSIDTVTVTIGGKAPTHVAATGP